jgi:molybdenum cofactor guanylyltransferase
MSKSSDIAIFILIGGKSSRMGTDKGVIKLFDKEMFLHVRDAALLLTENVFVVGNHINYRKYDCPLIFDIVPGCGPLGGIYTGLFFSPAKKNIFMSCDIPLINKEVISELIQAADDSIDALVPLVNGRKHPLCAIYHRRILPEIKKKICSGEFKMHHLLEDINTKYLSFPEGDEIGFENINTPSDFNRIQDLTMKNYG